MEKKLKVDTDGTRTISFPAISLTYKVKYHLFVIAIARVEVIFANGFFQDIPRKSSPPESDALPLGHGAKYEYTF